MDTYICIITHMDGNQFMEVDVVLADSEAEAIDKGNRGLPNFWEVHTVLLVTAEYDADIAVEVL